MVALAIGIVAGLALSRALQRLVFDVGPTDPLTFVGMAVLLALTALAACRVPARRASRVNPVTAMRSE